MKDLLDLQLSDANVRQCLYLYVTLLLIHSLLESDVDAYSEGRLMNASADVISVPDEQRLYQDLLSVYARTPPPPAQDLNRSKVLVNFQLSLHQIVDLDERRQILTTSVYINQDWIDDNLRWDELKYNGIRTLRVRSANVWLPDTFMLNNADETQSGFLRGIYVNLHSNGSVLWSFPQRLKSSCKVDIAFFPFDDQICTLRFGSWMYPQRLVDFKGSLESVDLSSYIDNSEWALTALYFQPTQRRHFDSDIPELVYVLRMRRRAFYYVFNIIVPCLMLSVLTLLTFWLPSTSGEKISLGLSVFLTFSMFMLLIAEEVPATSESVPLIGIYIMTVMTMTSISVIMAVMVINCYHRGQKFLRPPLWAARLVLHWIALVMQMSDDVTTVANTVQLDSDDEQRYRCSFHARQGNASAKNSDSSYQKTPAINSNRRPFKKRTNSFVETRLDGAGNHQRTGERRNEDLRRPVTCGARRTTWTGDGVARNTPASSQVETKRLLRRAATAATVQKTERNSRRPPSSQQQQQQQSAAARANADLEMTESVWITRESLHCTAEDASMRSRQQQQQRRGPSLHQNSIHSKNNENCSEHFRKLLPIDDDDRSTPGELRRSGDCLGARLQQQHQQPPDPGGGGCNKAVAMTARKRAIAEWQVMAAIVDRLLFWIFLLATVFTYLVILVGVPLMKSESTEFVPLSSNAQAINKDLSSRLVTTSQGQIGHND